MVRSSRLCLARCKRCDRQAPHIPWGLNHYHREGPLILDSFEGSWGPSKDGTLLKWQFFPFAPASTYGHLQGTLLCTPAYFYNIFIVTGRHTSE